MKKQVLLIVIIALFASCNVTESIVFNKDMSGEYSSSFDMSPMMKMANSQGSSSKDEVEMKKMDTTIVFNDLFKTHKDSIAALSIEERTRLEKLRGMTVKVHMDEANSVFEFSMIKPFKTVKELENINDKMDDAMGVVKSIGNKDGQAPEGQMDELTKTDEVSYTFVNNTFSRFQPVSEEENEVEKDTEDNLDEEGEDDFGKQFEMQFEEVFSASFYTLVYKFPRKVKSVSNKEATISEDGKTVFYEVSWSDINKDKSIMNLNIVLED